MSILSEITDKIRVQWSLKPRHVIHRGKEFPFALCCSLNEGRKLPAFDNAESYLTKFIRNVLFLVKWC